MMDLEERLKNINFNGIAANINMAALIPPPDQDPSASSTSGSPTSSSASKEREIETTTAHVQFNPPVYIQRYITVQSVLTELLKDPNNQDKINGRTMMEVGCAEFGMHVYLKNILELGKIVYLDLNKSLLMEKKYNLRPLPAEYLRKPTRPKPLVVEAYAGDITCLDTRILMENPKVWAVIAIELIEHLVPSDVRGFEISVFGIVSPDVVVVTTPNSEFNTVFNMAPGTFRHDDHKFEWTRAEFKGWCDKICCEFVGYQYSLHGIGEGTPETNHLGCVSQMAVFRKVQPVVPYHIGIVKDEAFQLLESIIYPNYIETRTPEQILADDVEYLKNNSWLSKGNIEYCMEHDINQFTFKMSAIKNMLPSRTLASLENADLEWMGKVLAATNKYTVIREGDEYALQIPIAFWDTSPQLTWWGEELDDEIEMAAGHIPMPRAEDANANTSDSFNSSSIDTDESWE